MAGGTSVEHRPPGRLHSSLEGGGARGCGRSLSPVSSARALAVLSLLLVLPGCPRKTGGPPAAGATDAGPAQRAEVEPNDRPEQSMPIGESTDVAASLSSTPARPDEDWYLLFAEQPRVAEVTVSGIPGTVVLLEAYDETRTRLAAASGESEGQPARFPNLTVRGKAAPPRLGGAEGRRRRIHACPSATGSRGRGWRSSPTTATPMRPSSCPRAAPGLSRVSTAPRATRTTSGSSSTPGLTPGRPSRAWPTRGRRAPPRRHRSPPSRPRAGLPGPAAAARGRPARPGRRRGRARATAYRLAPGAERGARRPARDPAALRGRGDALHRPRHRGPAAVPAQRRGARRRTGSSTWW